LSFRTGNGNGYERTYDAAGNELTYRNSNGIRRDYQEQQA